MIVAGTGSAAAMPAKEAGATAARAAAAQVPEARMAFVYTSVDYDVPTVLAGVAEAMPGVPVVGNTSFTGVITPDGFVGGEEGFVGILALGGEDLTVGVAGSPKGADARSTGEQVARAALKAAGREDAPTYFHMVANPGEEEYFLKGISDVIGRVPFFGGSAADNSIAGQWLLYADDAVFADGVAVAFFWTDAPFANVFTGAYRETGDVGLVTKVDGDRTLMEIDGVPAVEKYAQWTGVEASSLSGGDLLVATITSPLGVKDRLGELVAIRHPMNGNEDLSMALGSKIAEKTAVIRMEASIDELIDSAGDTLAAVKDRLGVPAAAYHLVHCGGRRAGIGDRIEEVVDKVRAQAGDVPFVMEFTFGEYGWEDDGNNTCGGLMLSYTAIGR